MRPVLFLPIAGLALLAACGSSPDRVTVASRDQADPVATAPAPESTTTTAPVATTTTSTGPATTTTRPAATTTTTRAATTTTTRPAARTVTVVPTANGSYTDVAVRGAGCSGPEYGVSLEIRDPAGQAIDGDGGLALPDGSWELHERFNSSRPAGQYSFHVTCTVTNGPAVFTYAPRTLDWTG